MKRTAFFISDGTGITAEALGQSLLAQFKSVQFEKITLPYIDSVEKAAQAAQRIDKAYDIDNEQPIIFDTIINSEVRAELEKSRGYMIDIFGTFLGPLEDALGAKSSYTVGSSHSITGQSAYTKRIDAMNFALENDDGGILHNYEEADIILVGVSRSGKTPTCIYLALQYGIKAANYPLTEDDILDQRLPKTLRIHKPKLFGLTIDPDRLASIRHERKPDSKYSSVKQCYYEVEEVELMYRRERIPFLNSTHYSIEEISTRLMVKTGIERRIA